MGSHRPGHCTRARPAQPALTLPAVNRPDVNQALRDEIRHSADLLRIMCCMATSERVLRGLSCYEHRELAGWLRWGVLDPLGREIERLSCRLVQLGGDAVTLP